MTIRPRAVSMLAAAALTASAVGAAGVLAGAAADLGPVPAAAAAAPPTSTPGATPPTVLPGSTTSSTTSSTSTTVPGPTTTTTPPTTVSGTTPATLPPNAPSVAQLDPEVPQDEAQLLGLIDEVNSRLGDLQAQLASLNTKLSANQSVLQADAAELSARQASLYDADRAVDRLEVERATARMAMRERAVAAYVHQPSSDLANMLLNLRDATSLVDARSFYRTLIDVQVQAIHTYDRLTKAAQAAAKQAASARDAALHQQQQVQAQTDELQSLKKTLEEVQSASEQQRAEQAKLLSQVGLDRAQFAAEVAAQAQESANIEQLLASLGTPGSNPQAPTGSGYFSWPIPGAPITSTYGPRVDPIAGYQGFHPGVDFGASQGTPIHAAGDGLVVYAGWENGYGNYTCINHGGGVATCYGHQSALLVKVGDTVTRGQVIGLVGTTGYSTGPHLHFEVRINGQVTDPMPWLTGSQGH